MNKPTKPNIVIPESFAENGIKTDFDNEKLTNGFDRLQPDVLAGDNLNKLIDDTYKGLNYGMAAADAINLINEGETLTVVDGKLTSAALIDAGRIDEQLANKADIDLNNLSSTGVEKFDGEWIDVGVTIIFQNRTLSKSETPVEFILDFLPDNGTYELLLYCYMTNINSTASWGGGIMLSSEIITTPIGANHLALPSYGAIGNTVTFWVKNKKIYLSGKSYYDNAKGTLVVMAYRKLGTGFEAI